MVKFPSLDLMHALLWTPVVPKTLPKLSVGAKTGHMATTSPPEAATPASTSRPTLPHRPTNRDPGPWKEVACENGIRTVEVADFRVFFEFVTTGFGDFDCDYLWRGQRSAAWAITSTLARSGKDEFRHLYHFRDAVARSTSIEYDVSDSNPARDEEKLKLWALGQHHGLATPLIDWTMYPFVALFFAFAERTEKGDDECRAVFALNWHEIASINFCIGESYGVAPFRERIGKPPYTQAFKDYLVQEFGCQEGALWMVKESKIPEQLREKLCGILHERCKQNWLHLYRSRSHENRRIHSQGGSHTYLPKNRSVEQWVETYYRVVIPPGLKSSPPVLTKVLIPTAERTNILRGLNRMNVNYLSLFPDFDGAAKHCNLALHERRYGLGFREY
jgi:hypothetical protein